MALYNVNGRDVFVDQDNGDGKSLADKLNVAGSKAKKPKRVSRVTKVAKMLLCHNVKTIQDVEDVIALGVQWGIIDKPAYQRANPQHQKEILLHFLIFFSNRVMYCRRPYKNNRTPLLTQLDRYNVVFIFKAVSIKIIQ